MSGRVSVAKSIPRGLLEAVGESSPLRLPVVEMWCEGNVFSSRSATLTAARCAHVAPLTRNLGGTAMDERHDAMPEDNGQELPSSEHSELLATASPDPTLQHYMASRIAYCCPTLRLLTMSAISGLLLLLGAGDVLRSSRPHAGIHGQVVRIPRGDRNYRVGGVPPEASQASLGDGAAGRLPDDRGGRSEHRHIGTNVAVDEAGALASQSTVYCGPPCRSVLCAPADWDGPRALAGVPRELNPRPSVGIDCAAQAEHIDAGRKPKPYPGGSWRYFAEWSGLDDEAREEDYYYGDMSYEGGLGDDRRTRFSYDGGEEVRRVRPAPPKPEPQKPDGASEVRKDSGKAKLEIHTLLRSSKPPFLLNDDFSVAHGLSQTRGEQ